jgi:hypothetical protein
VETIAALPVVLQNLPLTDEKKDQGGFAKTHWSVYISAAVIRRQIPQPGSSTLFSWRTR